MLARRLRRWANIKTHIPVFVDLTSTMFVCLVNPPTDRLVTICPLLQHFCLEILMYLLIM